MGRPAARLACHGRRSLRPHAGEGRIGKLAATARDRGADGPGGQPATWRRAMVVQMRCRDLAVKHTQARGRKGRAAPRPVRLVGVGEDRVWRRSGEQLSRFGSTGR
jgi:hypothetical protein